MQNPAAILERHLRRQANPRRLHPALRSTLLVLAIALPAFAAGAATMRLLMPADTATALHRRDAGRYFMPVHSRQLTVMLLPLVPSAKVEAIFAQQNSPTQKIARELVSADSLRQIADELPGYFPLGYSVAKPITLPDELFNFKRQQYRTLDTLTWLNRHNDARAFRTIGVLYADVFDTGYNFLFGQARLGGGVCIVSSARMGMQVANKTPHERYRAICAHELGHTLGLDHFKDRHSLMAFANSLEEHDTQGEAVTKANWDVLKRVHPIVWDR